MAVLALICALRLGAAIDWAALSGDAVLSPGAIETIDDAVIGSANTLSKITVQDGATLILNISSALTVPLHISGTGAKDASGKSLGALRMTVKSASATSGPATLILDGDALIVGNAASYMNGSTTLNGHTLTKTGGGALYLQTGSMTGDKGGVTVGPGSAGTLANLTLKPNYFIGDGEDGPLTLEDYSTFTMWNDAKCDRVLVVNGVSAKVALYDQYALSYWKTFWTDTTRCLTDIVLNEGAELNLSPNGLAERSLTVKGTVSGKGSLRVDSGAGRLFVNAAANTFEGGVNLDGRAGPWVQLAGAKSFPDYGNVTGNTAKVVLRRGGADNPWTDDAVGSFLSQAVLTNGSRVALNVDGCADKADSIVFGGGGASFGSSDASLAFGIDASYRESCLSVSGELGGYHPFFANTGRLLLTGNGRKEIGCLSVGEVLDKGAGTISVTDATDVNLDSVGAVAEIGGGTSSVARLNIYGSILKGSCPVTGMPDEADSTGSFMLAPNEKSLAFVDVQDSIVSNVGLRVATAVGSAAHYRQRGGLLLTVGGMGNQFSSTEDQGCTTKIGAGGCGSVELQNVVWTNAGHMTIADQGSGTVVIGGGSVEVVTHPLSPSPEIGANLNIGGSAHPFGHLYLTNTQMTVSGTQGYVYFCYGGGNGTLTVGKDASLTAARIYTAGARWNSQTQMVNVIDGGRLKADQFSSLYVESKYSVATPFYINLNGGTLIAPRSQSSTFLSGKSTMRQTSRVTVFAGGGRIETPYGDITSNIAIDAAPGKGIASVVVPDGGLSGYAAIPAAYVVGDGEGASVLPVFDPKVGAVTGFTVTSPGWNYTEAKIVLHDGHSEDCVLDCVLAENGAGAFRKSGPGTLILGRANSWSGDTVLEEGVLKCGVDGALPSGGTVVLAGGRLDMNGKKLSDGSPAPLAWAVDVADVLAKGTAALYNGDVNFAEGVTLTVRNVEKLDGIDANRVDLLTVTGAMGATPVLVSSQMAKWRIVWENGRLTARRNRGMSFIVR